MRIQDTQDGPSCHPAGRVALPPGALERLHGEAGEAYPEECCGLLIGVREGSTVVVRRALPCPNVAPLSERRRRFEIHPRVLIDTVRALRGGDESVVGFYHSHPDGSAELSETDLTYVALWPGTVWLVVPAGERNPARQTTARAWWLPSGAHGATAPLELPVDAPPPPAGGPA